MEKSEVKLNDHEVEALKSAAGIYYRNEPLGMYANIIDGWFRPMDIGGTDASNHSYTLKRLIAKGLIEKRCRSGWSRRSLLYRITEAGRAYITERKLISQKTMDWYAERSKEQEYTDDD